MNTKIKILTIAGAIAGAFTLMALNTSSDKKDFIIMKTYEAHKTVFLPNVIIVTKSDGTVESKELEPYVKDPNSSISNAKKVTATINEIQGQGYELVNFSGGGGVNGTVYTYYFRKK